MTQIQVNREAALHAILRDLIVPAPAHTCEYLDAIARNAAKAFHAGLAAFDEAAATEPEQMEVVTLGEPDAEVEAMLQDTVKPRTLDEYMAEFNNAINCGLPVPLRFL
jgi:hypothetical protein